MSTHKEVLLPLTIQTHCEQCGKIDNRKDSAQKQGPPKWKMFVLTFPSAYILSTLIVLPLLAVLPGWPFVAINLIVNGLLAFLLTYIALPLLNYTFRSWLYGRDIQRIIEHEEVSEAERFGENKRTQCAKRSQL